MGFEFITPHTSLNRLNIMADLKFVSSFLLLLIFNLLVFKVILYFRSYKLVIHERNLPMNYNGFFLDFLNLISIEYYEKKLSAIYFLQNFS